MRASKEGGKLKDMENFISVVAGFSLGYLALFLLTKLAIVIWWKPLQITNHFKAQGITGPPYKLLFGNSIEFAKLKKVETSKPMKLSHNIVARVQSHYHYWSKIYGPIFLMWFGPKPLLQIGSWELAKQVLGAKDGTFGKPLKNLILKEVIGEGLAVLNGEKWAHHRRIINPSFHIDKLKDMVSSMVESTANMLEAWEKVVKSGHESEVDASLEFNVLSSDIIARTAFGSNYTQGKHIFDLLAQVTSLACQDNTKLMVPGYRYLPLKRNRDCWRMRRDIKNSMKQLILNRKKTATNTNDLLGSMMNTVHELRNTENNAGLTTEEIIEECKTFFFAGQETTRNFMTYAIVLLAMHPEWQERARTEVLQVCGNRHPTFESQSKLKIVGMILNEVIRLYPPAVALLREAHKDTKLGELSIPAGTQVIFPLLVLNHDTALWGEDASEFKPERFSQGLANAAKDDSALFVPFGYGLRICVGQNFAMLEAKIIIAMILKRFSFVLSPAYVHAPTSFITLYPQHGVQIILHDLHMEC